VLAARKKREADRAKLKELRMNANKENEPAPDSFAADKENEPAPELLIL
jgi:hypothetical protein